MKRILIVEDDEKLAKALEMRIRSSGFETTVVNDGYSGVSAVAKCPPDLMLLDINLPAGDGFSVAERIRSIVTQPIPIVFITASRDPEFRDRARALGASGFVEKPYNPDQLINLLETTLHQATELSGQVRQKAVHPTSNHVLVLHVETWAHGGLNE